MVTADNCAKARELAAWKTTMARAWDAIETTPVTIENLDGGLSVGDKTRFSVDVDTKGLVDNGIGVELVITYKGEKGKDYIQEVCEFDVVKVEGSKLTFELVHKLKQSGEFRYGFRMFPKHADLPHRMNFCYVRWLQMAHI